MSLAERFHAKVDRRGPDECWPWTGAVTGKGYGHLRRGGRTEGWVYAHRLAYELEHGPIPDDLTIDHVRARGCTTPLCCNPAHLEVVTRVENTLRADAPSRRLHDAGVCVRGHDAAVHAYRRRSNGHVVYCRACRRERRRVAA